MSEQRATYTSGTFSMVVPPEMRADLTGETTPDPLQEYTQTWLNLQRFREANSLLIATLETLEGLLAEADAALRAHAREVGAMRDDITEVLVQHSTSRSYDGALLLKRAPWLEATGACKHIIEVDPKRVETLVKKGMLAQEALDGVIAETPRTPAVTIRPIGIRGER